MTEPAMTVETFVVRLVIVFVCVIVFFLIWKYLRDERYLAKYRNKSMFGKPAATQPNGLIKLSI